MVSLRATTTCKMYVLGGRCDTQLNESGINALETLLAEPGVILPALQTVRFRHAETVDFVQLLKRAPHGARVAGGVGFQGCVHGIWSHSSRERRLRQQWRIVPVVVHGISSACTW